MKGESSTMLPELVTKGPSLILEDTALSHVYLSEIIKHAILYLIGCVALFAGLLNIVNFARMDLSQGVNLNLLILSVSDFLVVATSISGYICSLLLASGHYFIAGIPVFQVWLLFNVMVNYPLNTSFVVTTVIAVVRCLCVTIPLSFRDIVTSCRQVIIIAVGSCTSVSVPLYVHLYTPTYVPEGNDNSTELVLIDSRVVVFFVGAGTFLNVALNSPVYFVCNSRYRMLVMSTFCKSSE
ncbi:hypothetical protein RRG08_006721 [Elysia crispata]|uniref:G-protein coupled receptors family 1 profile domain-containing protein n=1 Tax=Elysia crispata TaxID=231223 RepID=A0AAE1EF91_9GAST|nr:hypothetical protein RRG08_006721 [Elysia crispata]